MPESCIKRTLDQILNGVPGIMSTPHEIFRRAERHVITHIAAFPACYQLLSVEYRGEALALPVDILLVCPQRIKLLHELHLSATVQQAGLYEQQAHKPRRIEIAHTPLGSPLLGCCIDVPVRHAVVVEYVAPTSARITQCVK